MIFLFCPSEFNFFLVHCFFCRGSAVAKIIGDNVKKLQKFASTVKMWVFEETVNGRKLTDIINNDHENVKYLPGHKLPENVVRLGDEKYIWLILKVMLGGSLVSQRVKDLVLSLQWLGPRLWCRFSPWPRNFHMPQVRTPKKRMLGVGRVN